MTRKTKRQLLELGQRALVALAFAAVILTVCSIDSIVDLAWRAVGL